MPKSLCSYSNGLLFTPNSLSGLIRVSTVPSGRHGGGRGVVLHARSALHEYSGRGGFEWVSLRRCE